jgi:hypothetical protein
MGGEFGNAACHLSGLSLRGIAGAVAPPKFDLHQTAQGGSDTEYRRLKLGCRDCKTL